jgi:hypothetical protein
MVMPRRDISVGIKVGRKEAYRSLKKCPTESMDNLNPELSVWKRRKVFDVIKKNHSFG